MMKLTKTILKRIMWLARGTATMVGFAVMVAVVLGVGTTALAAVPGDPFKLGQANAINTLSRLVGTTNTPLLRIDNNSAGASATALDLQVERGKAPMKVNSAARVANLNADRVDGKHANQLIRVASFAGPSPLPNGTDGTVATTNITAPAPGFLVIDAGSDLFNPIQFDVVRCGIEVDNATAPGSERFMELNAPQSVNQEEDCSTNTVVPVSAGQHKIDLQASLVDSPNTIWEDTALSAIYVPFGGAGAPPSSAAVFAARQEAASPETREGSRNP
jgi:hypothetical protein